MKPPLIINIATKGREDYYAMREPLLESIDKHWKGDKWIFDDFPEGCRKHSERAYAFKFDLIKKAVDEGYRFVWWSDCSMRLNGDVMKLMKVTGGGIVCFHNLGYHMAPYTSDLAMENMNCASYIDNVLHLWGGFFGFDFDNPIAIEALERIMDQIELGSFESTGSYREDFIAPRNDQTVLSIICHDLDVDPYPYGIVASVPDKTENTLVIYGD